MADRDFNIKIVTTADTSGIAQTEAGLARVQKQSQQYANVGGQTGVEKFIAAQNAAKQAAASAAAASAAQGSGAAGFGAGSYAGVASIILLFRDAIRRIEEFNDEEDRFFEQQRARRAKVREEGLAIADELDREMKSARIAAEPLDEAYNELTQSIRVLTAERKQALEANDTKDWHDKNAALKFNQGLLDGVISRTEKLKEARERAREQGVEQAVKELDAASPQAKAILAQEQAAKRAFAEGRTQEAREFERSAEQFRRGATPAQQAEATKIDRDIRGAQRGDPAILKALSEVKTAVEGLAAYWR